MKRMALVLTSVVVIAGLALAAADVFFAPRIAAQRAKELSRSLSEVFPEAASLSFERTDSGELTIYLVSGPDDKTLGYAVEVETPGYGGPIELLVRISADLTAIGGIAVVSNVETPGLGGRIVEQAFLRQFTGMNPTLAFSYVKNRDPKPILGEIDAITGATITTNAVVSGLKSILPEAVQAIAVIQ